VTIASSAAPRAIWANVGLEPAFSNSPYELAAFARRRAATRSKAIRAIGLMRE
jgi:hypothetical protein